MNRILIPVIFVLAVLPALGTGSAAQAQTILPGSSPLLAPLPLPLPPPRIEAPVVPKMDEMPRQAQPSPRPSFSDRITTCLQQGAAAGLSPGDRDTYSRSCANR
jgi:hypothetical protein